MSGRPSYLPRNRLPRRQGAGQLRCAGWPGASSSQTCTLGSAGALPACSFWPRACCTGWGAPGGGTAPWYDLALPLASAGLRASLLPVQGLQTVR